MTKSIKDLLRAAKKRRQNRAYYAKYCGITDLRTAGVLQDPEKTRLDLVQIEDGERNELIHLFGFNPKDSSHFRLKLSIVSLLDRWFVQGVQDASKWRLASVSLTLRLASGVQLSYEHEQLIDYDQKRQAADRHEHRNIYKVGSVSIETVLPFSLSRILFNGLMRVESDGGPTGSASSVSQFRPIRLTISTHPTCDKFDYAYRFGSSYSADVISRSMRASQEQDVERSLALLLEDRFDQPLMFQGDLETLDGSGGKDDNQELPQLDETFVMWGAKVKKYLDARRELTTSNSQKDEPRDCLFVWTECGHQIHLSRPERHPNLLYGMVHNSFDYASYLYEASLNMFEKTNGDEDVAVTVEKRIEFSELDQFKQLTSSHVIRLRAFKVREYKLEFLIDDASAGATSDSDSSRSSLMRVRLNGFDGWALRLRLDFGELIEETQNKLLLMALNDRLLSSKLAEEKLLGGKGSSLAGLSQSLEMGIRVDRLSLASSCEVSVPRGLVITSHAYGWWLRSDERIMKSIRELDAARRELATRSALQLNPMSSDSGTCLPSLGEIQRTLQALCQQTRAQLIECPLPESLRQQLCRDLVGIFGEEALGLGGPPPADNDSAEASQAPQLKKFAVRSSAVGEDSLETSAAGQMRTILNARGIDSICQAVVECWASQFELEAVTYKSQNGLQFNLPMAVVVQELVECQVAGVAATCDPMTGNRTRLEITANRGLGEGVVSGKQADTIRVTLTNLKWDARLEDYTNQSVSLKSEEADGDQLAVSKIEKLTTKDGECCLTDEQIVALANLLLEIRRTNELQDREVEWGITMIKPEENAEATMVRPQTPDSSTTSSSSSSSSSSTDTGVTLVPFRRAEFKIHMFQSRPLTNLRRLSTREIDHELDYGAQSPLDLCSRANLGEVMPGALCPINQSWFMPMVSSYLQQRPDLKEYTRNYYSMAWFGFHTGLATSILTNCMSVKYYFNDNEHDRQLQQAVNYTMVGTMFDKPSNEIELDKFERFCRERQLPLMQPLTPGLGILLPVDLGIFQTLELAAKRDAAKTKLHDDLLGLNELIELVKGDCGQDDGRHSEQILCEQIRRLFERLTKRTSPLTKAWVCHLLASFTSVAFNMMSLKIIGDQPAYKGKSLVDNELLNDFSVLIRKSVKGGTNQLGDHHQSESGDISKLLERLLECFVETKQLELMKTMKPLELYKYLTDPANDQLKSSKLFGEFMARNGHRAWKEFCLGTKTWGDDPSYIMRLFAARLKAYSPEEADRERARKLAANSDHEAQLERVSAKLTNNRFVLMNYALPRARNATMRRESSKSLLIKTIHKYRQAFRHLAGLLCLAGLLPNAELIFFMTIQELDEIVVKCCSLDESARQPRETIMPRLLYKARRRQQRCRLFDKVTFPRPTVSVNEMIESIQEQTRQWDGPKMPVLPVAASGHHSDQPVESTLSSDRPEVRGITSCSGCVTGRACVISSLDDVDQLEPNDILVTYSIDISWSVYFFMLAGIVTEVGGIVSHGAVVAREYGLPTLCTAVGACTKFKTGQLITLNASRGVCHLATKDNDEGTV